MGEVQKVDTCWGWTFLQTHRRKSCSETAPVPNSCHLISWAGCDVWITGYFPLHTRLISSRCEEGYGMIVSLNPEIKSLWSDGLWRVFWLWLSGMNHLLEHPHFFSSVNLSSWQLDEAHRLEPAQHRMYQIAVKPLARMDTHLKCISPFFWRQPHIFSLSRKSWNSNSFTLGLGGRAWEMCDEANMIFSLLLLLYFVTTCGNSVVEFKWKKNTQVPLTCCLLGQET